MFTFIYENKEEIIEEVLNGKCQDAIYEYLKGLLNSYDSFPICSEDDLFEYFAVQYGNEFYELSSIKIRYKEELIVLHNTILNTYKRFLKDIRNSPEDSSICRIGGLYGKKEKN